MTLSKVWQKKKWSEYHFGQASDKHVNRAKSIFWVVRGGVYEHLGSHILGRSKSKVDFTCGGIKVFRFNRDDNVNASTQTIDLKFAL